MALRSRLARGPPIPPSNPTQHNGLQNPNPTALQISLGRFETYSVSLEERAESSTPQHDRTARLSVSRFVLQSQH
ncbi:hypothetical protein BC835DRAFT_1317516 [Cytidiella melzeri]|nr:hypothetical protein BC835DRAFT_1317516 [Cytidiella melzeri]